MLVLVPVRVNLLVAQAKVGRKIDHALAGVKGALAQLGACAMRQAREHHIHLIQWRVIAFDQREVKWTWQHVAQTRAGVAFRMRKDNVRLAVPRKQLEQLHTGVAGRPEDTNSDHF